jgi:hypothetical protein
MPVIPATWESETGDPCQSGQKGIKTLFKKKKSWVLVVYACIPRYLGG